MSFNIAFMCMWVCLHADKTHLDEIDKMLMPEPFEHANLPQGNLLHSRIILCLQKFLDCDNLEMINSHGWKLELLVQLVARRFLTWNS